jgi:hypothetical protein
MRIEPPPFGLALFQAIIGGLWAVGKYQGQSFDQRDVDPPVMPVIYRFLSGGTGKRPTGGSSSFLAIWAYRDKNILGTLSQGTIA